MTVTFLDEDKPKKRTITFLDDKPKKTTVTFADDEDGLPTRIGKSIASGAVGSVDGLSSFFKSLGDDGELLGSALLAKATKSVGDKMKSITEPALDALRVENPGWPEKIASGLGSTATFFVPGLGVAKSAQALKLAPRAAKLLGAGLASTLESGVSAGQVYDRLRSKGYNEDEAGAEANKSFFANIPATAILDTWMFAGSGAGGVLTNALKGMSQEGAQEGIQQMIQNYFSKDPVTEGVAESAAVGGIVGGGVRGVMSKLDQRTELQPEEEGAAPELPDNAMPLNDNVQKSKKQKVQALLDFGDDVKTKTKAFGKKYFTSAGNMPPQVYSLSDQMKGELSELNTDIEFIVRDYNAVEKSHGKLTEQEALTLNDALNGQVDLSTTPLNAFIKPIKAMRNKIDVLSQRLIDEGVAQGPLAVKIDANKGAYVTRSYEIHSNPKWISQLKKDGKKWNRLVAWYKKELGKGVFRFIPQNIDAPAIVGTPSKLGLTTNSERINKILDKFGSKFDKAKSSLDSIETKIDDRQRILNKNEINLEKTKKENLTKKAQKQVSHNRLDSLMKKSEQVDKKLQNESIDNIRRVKLNKRRWNLDEEMDAEIQAIDDKILVLKNSMKEDAINKSESRLLQSKNKLDNLVEKQQEFINLKDEYGQAVYDIAFKEDANFVSQTGGVYKASEANVKEALDFMKINEAEVDPMLHNILEDAQGDFKNFYSSKLGSKSLGIFRKRKVMEKEMLELLGEIRDSHSNFVNSAKKIGTLISHHNFLTDVKSAGEGSFLFNNRNQVIDGVRYNVPLGTTDEYSPLSGMYTSKEIAESLKIDADTRGELTKVAMKVIGASKIAKTILSHITHIRNVSSNIFFATANGNFDVTQTKQAINAVRTRLNLGKQDEGSRNYVLKLARLGLIDQSSDVGIAKETGFIGDNIGVLKKPYKKISDWYQAEDYGHKVYAFENEVKKYKKAFPKKSLDELEGIAAEIVKNTYPTFSRVPRGIKFIGKTPLVGSFVSFPAETIRTSYNTFVIAKKEMSNPATRPIGQKRLAGLVSTVTATAYMVPALFRMVSGVDKEKEDALRKFVPEWSKDSPLAITGWNKDKHEYSYIDIGGQMPHAYLVEPVIAFMQGKDVSESMFKALKVALSPFVSEEMLTEKMLDISRNTTKEGRPIYSDMDPDIDKFFKGTKHLLRSLEPGSVSSAKKLLKKTDGTPGYYGNVTTQKNEIVAHLTGVRLSQYNIPKTLGTKAFQFKDKLTQSLKASTYEDVAGKEDAYRRSYQWMHDHIQAARKLGVPDKKIETVLVNRKVGKRRVQALMLGDWEEEIQAHVERLNAQKNK